LGSNPICPAEIEKYFSYRKRAGDKPSTQRTLKRILLIFLKWKCREDNNFRATLEDLREIQLPQPVNRNDVIPEQDVLAIIEQPDPRERNGLRDRVILELLYCGLRRIEVATLTMNDIDMREGYVKIRSQNAKNNKERWIYLSDGAFDALNLFIPALSSEERIGPLFHLKPESIGDVVARRAINAKVGHCTPHQFRHAFATYMERRGAKMRDLQTLLGHSSVRITEGYVHSEQRYADEAMRRFHPRMGELPPEPERPLGWARKNILKIVEKKS